MNPNIPSASFKDVLSVTIIAITMSFLMSSCVKDPEPSMPQDVHFSILGDSYSAMEGYVDPETNDVWYYENIGLVDVEQMWWRIMATKLGWTLEKNNSFSGALICNFYGYNAGPYYSPHSFIRRMDGLGNPDVIFVFGGTNDVWNGAYCGEYVYSDWTEGQLEFYRPALAYLFENLKSLYPKAKIFFLLDMSLCDYDYSGQVFVESVHQIAKHYRIYCVDLHDIHKDWAHPNAQGMSDIATQVVEAVQLTY